MSVKLRFVSCRGVLSHWSNNDSVETGTLKQLWHIVMTWVWLSERGQKWGWCMLAYFDSTTTVIDDWSVAGALLTRDARGITHLPITVLSNHKKWTNKVKTKHAKNKTKQGTKTNEWMWYTLSWQKLKMNKFNINKCL